MSLKWNKPQSILIHAPNWVGDHVMAFGFYVSIRHVFPKAKIELIGRTWISSLLPKDIFSDIHILDGKKLSKKNKEKLIQKKFDTSFTLSPSFRSAQLLFSLKIPIRIGYKTDFRSMLLQIPPKAGAQNIPPYSVYEHRSLSYIRLLTPWMEANTTSEEIFNKYIHSLGSQFSIQTSKEEESNTLMLMKDHGLKKSSFWIICPGSVAPSKVYPLEYLAKIIVKYLETTQKKKPSIVFIGSKIEKKYVLQLKDLINTKYHSSMFDFTEKTRLNEAVILMRNAAGIIANDSGIAHMASFTSSPLITFLGMGRKEETLTLAREKSVLNLNLKCSPCMKKHCPRKDAPIECLRGISPDMVFSEMMRHERKMN